MQITMKSKTFLCLFTLLIVQNVNGADNTTTKATDAPSPATTPKPKIRIADSALCKKCICDTDDHLLDCSNGHLKDWFTSDDIEALQNGDYTFETFKLQNNSLKEVPIFPPYPVRNLYLSHNQIEKIAIDAFRNLTELTVLDLSNNQLTSKVLLPDVFRGTYATNDYLPLAKMKELDLGYNLLHTLNSDLFEHLPNLETLVLCKNVFRVFDHSSVIAITELSSLKTLDISYMELEELPDNFLHGPRDLETLILTGNLLTKLPTDNLKLAINLKDLVLDENLIGDIGGENKFPAMQNLRYLSLQYMPHLTKIANEAFSELQNLTTLILSDNPKLNTIEERAFTKNTTNPKIFDYVPLEELHLNNNNLSVLESKLVERWDKIKTIDLRFNPWTCDLSNDYLINALMIQIEATTPLLAKDVKCGSPEEFKSMAMNEPTVKQNLSSPSSNAAGVAIACVLVALLIGIPMIIGTVVLYRRGCFGLLYKRGTPAGAHYSRAGSAEDLHI